MRGALPLALGSQVESRDAATTDERRGRQIDHCITLEDFMVDKDALGTRFSALYMVGGDDIGRWEGADTSYMSVSLPSISKNLEKT